jgi:hypothetical protein
MDGLDHAAAGGFDPEVHKAGKIRRREGRQGRRTAGKGRKEERN